MSTHKYIDDFLLKYPFKVATRWTFQFHCELFFFLPFFFKLNSRFMNFYFLILGGKGILIFDRFLITPKMASIGEAMMGN